jgi:hypothetical protein
MKKIILSLALLIIANIIVAQEEGLKFDEVKVIKEFSAQIGNYNKISIDPVLPLYDISKRTYEYSIKTIPAKLEYEKPRIRPLALKPETPREFSNYYIKAGYGAPRLIDIDAAANFRKNMLLGGINIGHTSANNNDNTPDQNISISKLGINLKKFTEGHRQTYGLDADVSNSYFYLYGKEPGDTEIYDDTKRRYLSTDITASVFAKQLIGNTDNKTELNLKTLQLNAENVSETTISLANTSIYLISDYSSVEVPARIDITTNTGAYVFNIQPFFMYSTRPFKLKAGAHLGVSSDINLIAPYIEISSNLYNNFIEVFASYKSDFFHNTDYLKAGINPFIAFEKNDTRTSRFENMGGGIRSSMEGVMIEGKVIYQKFSNHMFFQNNPDDTRTFMPVYDDGTNLKIEALATYSPLKTLKFGGSVIKHFYDLDNFTDPWFTPELEANIFTTIKFLSERIIIGGELYFGSAPWYEDTDGNRKKLDNLFDLNASAKFMISGKSGMFINVNNVFAQKYRRWYNYENYGTNLLVGLELRF